MESSKVNTKKGQVNTRAHTDTHAPGHTHNAHNKTENTVDVARANKYTTATSKDNRNMNKWGELT